MIGVVVLAHGKLGHEMLNVAQSILGHQEYLTAVSVPVLPKDQQVDVLIADLSAAIESTDQGDGVIVLTDIFTGTCSTVCKPLFRKYNIEIISGMNLPAILDIIHHRRSNNLKGIAREAMRAGVKSIVDVNEILAKEDVSQDRV
jgi:PTS system mannose-specific IIA component